MGGKQCERIRNEIRDTWHDVEARAYGVPTERNNSMDCTKSTIFFSRSSEWTVKSSPLMPCACLTCKQHYAPEAEKIMR